MENIPFVNIHTHNELSNAIGLRSLSPEEGMPPGTPGTLFSAGIHPWEAGRCRDLHEARQKLRRLLVMPGVVAVGETGIDLSPAWRHTHQEQTALFRVHLEEAAAAGMPLIIHCVKAFEQVLALLLEYRPQGAVFHGFIGSQIQAQAAAKAGFFLSFGARSLRSPRTVGALRSLPADAIFAETDDSAESIEHIYDSISYATGISIAELKEKLYNNISRLLPETERRDNTK